MRPDDLDQLKDDLISFRAELEQPGVREELIATGLPRLLATLEMIPDARRGERHARARLEPLLPQPLPAPPVHGRAACTATTSAPPSEHGADRLVHQRTGEELVFEFDLFNIENDDFPYPDESVRRGGLLRAHRASRPQPGAHAERDPPRAAAGRQRGGDHAERPCRSSDWPPSCAAAVRWSTATRRCSATAPATTASTTRASCASCSRAAASPIEALRDCATWRRVAAASAGSGRCGAAACASTPTRRARSTSSCAPGAASAFAGLSARPVRQHPVLHAGALPVGRDGHQRQHPVRGRLVSALERAPRAASCAGSPAPARRF